MQETVRKPKPPRAVLSDRRPQCAADIVNIGDTDAVTRKTMMLPIADIYGKERKVKERLNRKTNELRKIKRENRQAVLAFVPEHTPSRRVNLGASTFVIQVKRTKGTRQVSLDMLRGAVRPIVGEYLAKNYPDMVGKPFNKTAMESLAAADFHSIAIRVKEAMENMYRDGSLSFITEDIVVKKL